MALRIAAALAEAGVKVISGVPDGEQAASIQVPNAPQKGAARAAT